MSTFGRTGKSLRPRIRKFHAEILYTKFLNREKVLNATELGRPIDYMKRMVKYSKGFLKFINEEAGEVKLTDSFFLKMEGWMQQYSNKEELDHSDENLIEQGIILKDEGVSFDGRLTYSRFYKVVSDEGESINDPKSWQYNDKNIETFDYIDFANKDSPLFSSKLFNLKFYILRKIDEVSFVTSRFVHCPNCGANYVVPAAKIDFLATYKCEQMIGDKPCNTTLKKFPVRKMIPTYIYEISVEVRNKETTEYKEFYLESFTPLSAGYYVGMCFGRTEAKSNSFYFTCLTAKEEKSVHEFKLIDNKHSHAFFNIVDSVINHIKGIGFVLEEDKAKLPVLIETLKKLNTIINKEINLDHSLYFGAPGIGKTYALTMLHHLFYSNSGFISGPRFSLAGLTGGQKDIYYQDTSKKKNVPGLFSNQAFVFDEINNATFLHDDKAINLFKSVALSASGTATTVGGKEFPRISLIAATANYDLDYLRFYENKIKKVYTSELKESDEKNTPSNNLLIGSISSLQSTKKINKIPEDFDYYANFKDYSVDVDKILKTSILKIRDNGKNYLTDFPKPLMERFYWAVLVHPKHDKQYRKQKEIDVAGFMKYRDSNYSQRELMAQLYVSNFDELITNKIKETKAKFEDPETLAIWTKQAEEFLYLMSSKYIAFFSMFSRINQVHVFTLYTLSLINKETELSFETKRIFEKLISLLHTPIELYNFHKPNFIKGRFIGETTATILEIIKRYPNNLKAHLDYSRERTKKVLVDLQNNNKIKKIDDYHFEIIEQKFEKIKEAENENFELRD